MQSDGFNHDTGQSEPTEYREPARQPDGLVVPSNTLQSRASAQDDQDEATSQNGTGAATPSTRRSWEDLNFAELDVFADTGTTRLTIPNSGGKFITVKNELDFGEQATLDNISIKGVQRADVEALDQNQTVVLDLARQRLYILAMYIVGWNIVDRNKKVVNLPRTTDERLRLFRRMNANWGELLMDLIQKHINARQEAMRLAEAADERAMGLMPVDDRENPENADPKLSTAGR